MSSFELHDKEVGGLFLVGTTAQKFKGTNVSLDGRSFTFCDFKNCTVFYAGGPFKTHECRFEGCRWVLHGDAALVVERLTELGWQVASPKEQEQEEPQTVEVAEEG